MLHQWTIKCFATALRAGASRKARTKDGAKDACQTKCIWRMGSGESRRGWNGVRKGSNGVRGRQLGPQGRIGSTSMHHILSPFLGPVGLHGLRYLRYQLRYPGARGQISPYPGETSRSQNSPTVQSIACTCATALFQGDLDRIGLPNEKLHPRSFMTKQEFCIQVSPAHFSHYSHSITLTKDNSTTQVAPWKKRLMSMFPQSVFLSS